MSRLCRRVAVLLLVLALAGCNLQKDVAVDPHSGPSVGTVAPTVDGTALDGSHFDLASQHGHPVVIDFFASWCGPCRQQQPALDAAAAREGPRGVVFVGVGFRDSEASLRGYLQQFAVPYPALADLGGDIAGHFEVLAPPTTVVVDPAGRVAATFFGNVDATSLESLLDHLRA